MVDIVSNDRYNHLVAATPRTRQLVVWDIRKTDRVLQKITDTSQSEIGAITASCDGRLILTAGSHVRAWGAEKAEENRNPAMGGKVDARSTANVSNRGGGEDGDGGGEDAAEGTMTPVYCIVSEAFNQIARIGMDGRVAVFDICTGKITLQFSSKQRDLTSVAVDSSGRRLATASHDGSVKTWNLNSGEELFKCPSSSLQEISCMAFLSKWDAPWPLACGGWDRVVTMYPGNHAPKVRYYRESLGSVLIVPLAPYALRTFEYGNRNTYTDIHLRTDRDHLIGT